VTTLLDWMRDPLAQRVVFCIWMVLFGSSAIAFRRQFTRVQTWGLSLDTTTIRRLEKLQAVGGFVAIVIGVGVLLFA
jgi:hypothetical protein